MPRPLYITCHLLPISLIRAVHVSYTPSIHAICDRVLPSPATPSSLHAQHTSSSNRAHCLFQSQSQCVVPSLRLLLRGYQHRLIRVRLFVHLSRHVQRCRLHVRRRHGRHSFEGACGRHLRGWYWACLGRRYWRFGRYARYSLYSLDEHRTSLPSASSCELESARHPVGLQADNNLPCPNPREIPYPPTCYPHTPTPQHRSPALQRVPWRSSIRTLTSSLSGTVSPGGIGALEEVAGTAPAASCSPCDAA